MAAVSLTLHNLRPWAESYELTTDCICETLCGATIETHRAVKSEDGKPGLVREVKTYPPTVTIPARGKVSGIPLAARNAPAVKAGVAAGALRISEDGSAAPAPKHSKSAGQSK